MICVSIAERDFKLCRNALLSSAFAELRIDKTDFAADEIRELFALPVDIIATCRPGIKSKSLRESLLSTALSAGAAYVDIELDAPADLFSKISDLAKVRNAKLILSYHNGAHTPQMTELIDIRDHCFEKGADIAKIVCRAHSPSDCARLLSLYQEEKNLIAFSMGKKGTFTRIASLFLGAPFTYAALAPGKETADGQLDREGLQKILDAIP
ncbi:MAG: type I 3-dehydroquinate dehydratase [Candidatus Aminicenantes bacterium]|jgi:3-dehydroquinate dehydratase type I